MSVPKFILAPGEYFCICPYNTFHVMTNLKIDGHVFKCRMAHFRDMEKKKISIEYDFCRYNDMHKVPRIEKGFHEERCSSREGDRVSENFIKDEIIRRGRERARAQAATQPAAKAHVDDHVDKNAIWAKEPENPPAESCPVVSVPQTNEEKIQEFWQAFEKRKKEAATLEAKKKELTEF